MRLLTSEPFHETITEVLRRAGRTLEAVDGVKGFAWRSRITIEKRRIPATIDATAAEASTERRTPQREEDQRTEPTTTNALRSAGYVLDR
jgi:hypothetical protein